MDQLNTNQLTKVINTLKKELDAIKGIPTKDDQLRIYGILDELTIQINKILVRNDKGWLE